MLATTMAKQQGNIIKESNSKLNRIDDRTDARKPQTIVKHANQSKPAAGK